MLELQFFRLKVYPAKQRKIFEKLKTPSEILRNIVLSKPMVEIKKGTNWRIGNVTEIDEQGIYFRFGRISKSKLGMLKGGDFVDQQIETAPNTHVLLDVQLELCVIAKEPTLSQKTVGVAHRFAKVLLGSRLNQDIQAVFEISEMNDPDDFITHLRQAKTVSKFWIRFSRPNLFDVNKDFVKPWQGVLNESNGEKGKAEIEGESLKVESLEELTRSAAATGDDAGASFQTEGTAKKIKKRLKGNPLTLFFEDLTGAEQMKKLLKQVREKYFAVRGDSQ